MIKKLQRYIVSIQHWHLAQKFANGTKKTIQKTLKRAGEEAKETK